MSDSILETVIEANKIPESVFKTLLSALENYVANEEEKMIARNWLYTYYTIGRTSSEEAAEIRAALATADTEGGEHTLEEVEQEIFDMIANYEPKKERVKI
jgi:hypothetical protein